MAFNAGEWAGVISAPGLGGTSGCTQPKLSTEGFSFVTDRGLGSLLVWRAVTVKPTYISTFVILLIASLAAFA
jgi:hypothetical protein